MLFGARDKGGVHESIHMTEKHYLASELEDLIRSDNSIWEFLQRGSLDGCWYWDLENPDQEWMSPEFWKLFGIDPASKSHDPAEWQDIIFPEDGSVALENFHKHCADPNHPYDQIVRYRHADGSTVWVRCRGIAIRDETGKPLRMLGAHNDLTAVKQAEEAAVAGKRVADAASEELRSFAYALSHELKAPSNTLKLLIAELEQSHGDQIDQSGHELLNHGRNTIDRMQALIEDLLLYTRAVEQQFEFSRINLNTLLTDVISDLTGDIDETGAKIECDSLSLVSGNERQLRILFQNLISNAIKFRVADKPPRIKVQETSSPRSDRVTISVADNGIGIPGDKQERIFAMFGRLHTEREYPGSGLGLALCQRIAVKHGSDIGVRSEPGKGSVFTVSLRRA